MIRLDGEHALKQAGDNRRHLVHLGIDSFLDATPFDRQPDGPDRRRFARAADIPLFWYLAVTLGAPFVNGAYRDPGFWSLARTRVARTAIMTRSSGPNGPREGGTCPDFPSYDVRLA